jgi:hypothetical protein
MSNHHIPAARSDRIATGGCGLLTCLSMSWERLREHSERGEGVPPVKLPELTLLDKSISGDIAPLRKGV